MTNGTDLLNDIHGTEGSVEIGNGTTVQIFTVGTLVLTTTIDGINSTVSIRNVAYIPELTTNFLSVSRLQQNEVEVCTRTTEFLVSRYPYDLIHFLPSNS